MKNKIWGRVGQYIQDSYQENGPKIMTNQRNGHHTKDLA